MKKRWAERRYIQNPGGWCCVEQPTIKVVHSHTHFRIQIIYLNKLCFVRIIRRQNTIPPFFYDSNPSWPLINRLKYFQIRFRFCRDIQILKKLRSVHPTVESDSAVCITPWSQTPRCASYHGVKLPGVHRTARSQVTNFSKNSAVCIPMRSQALRCASHRRVKPCGVHHTVESTTPNFSKNSTVCIRVECG